MWGFLAHVGLLFSAFVARTSVAARQVDGPQPRSATVEGPPPLKHCVKKIQTMNSQSDIDQNSYFKLWYSKHERFIFIQIFQIT